jgi:hypothetical protein
MDAETYRQGVAKRRVEVAQNRYRHGIRKIFEHHIFEQRMIQRAIELDRIIEKNSELLGNVSPTFIYNGTRYHASYYMPQRGDNRLIHPDMLQHIRNFTKEEDFSDTVEYTQLMNFIGNAILVANHVNDLFKLLPDRLHKPVYSLISEGFNRGNPLTDAEVNKFRDENITGLKAFGQLFLKQLLLS